MPLPALISARSPSHFTLPRSFSMRLWFLRRTSSRSACSTRLRVVRRPVRRFPFSTSFWSSTMLVRFKMTSFRNTHNIPYLCVFGKILKFYNTRGRPPPRGRQTAGLDDATGGRMHRLDRLAAFGGRPDSRGVRRTSARDSAAEGGAIDGGCTRVRAKRSRKAGEFSG